MKNKTFWILLGEQNFSSDLHNKKHILGKDSLEPLGLKCLAHMYKLVKHNFLTV